MANVKKKSLKNEHVGQMIFEVSFAPNIQKLCKSIENHSIFYFFILVLNHFIYLAMHIKYFLHAGHRARTWGHRSENDKVPALV